jgi:hypothetical protein
MKIINDYKHIETQINIFDFNRLGLVRLKTSERNKSGKTIALRPQVVKINFEEMFPGKYLLYKSVEIDSSLYFTPVQFNLMKIIYGRALKTINSMKAETFEGTKNETLILNVTELSKEISSTNCKRSELIGNVELINTTMDKLSRVQIIIKTCENEKIYTNLLESVKEVIGSNQWHFKLSEYMQIERPEKIKNLEIFNNNRFFNSMISNTKDKKELFNGSYSKVDVHIDFYKLITDKSFNRHSQLLLTYLKSCFDHNFSLKTIFFNVENDLEKIYIDYDEKSDQVKRRLKREFFSSMESIMEHPGLKKYFKKHSKNEFEIKRF